jgi:hypothetical protein
VSKIEITVTLDCGHVLTYEDEIKEKYPFWCPTCEQSPTGKYPWELTARIIP